MTKNELREKLAALEHDRWSRWERYRETAKDKTREDTGLDEPNRERWIRQRETPYSELTEQEKDSDRAEADTTLEIIWPLLEEWYQDGVRNGRKMESDGEPYVGWGVDER